MPLRKGCSRRAIAANVKTERRRGRPRRQALAIALDTARKAAEKAGTPAKGPGPAPDGPRRQKRPRRRRAGRLRGMPRER